MHIDNRVGLFQTMLIMVSILLHVHVYPYHKVLDNALELLTLSQVLISFQIAILIEALQYQASNTATASSAFVFQLFDVESIKVIHRCLTGDIITLTLFTACVTLFLCYFCSVNNYLFLYRRWLIRLSM